MLRSAGTGNRDRGDSRGGAGIARGGQGLRLSGKTIAPCIALFAMFRIVRKLFVVEEELLTRCKHKTGSAVDAR
jgi:hypothetical protein